VERRTREKRLQERRGIMTTKEKIIQAVQELPANATIEDAMERLLFLAKVERGLKQADAGETISHMELKERMAEWLK
jgi:predicted transcriptional regulator